MAETDWKKLAIGLKKYLHLMDTIQKVDVSVDKDFQRKFKGFYRIRRGQRFCDLYFSILQKNKGNKALSFESVLRELVALDRNRLEASFASKLIATINPEMPIWDKIVLSHVEKDFEDSAQNEDRIKNAVAKYEFIIKHHSERLTSEDGKEKLHLFNQNFPKANITDIKKIDLILWQTR